ncbi:Rieske domain-containing protein [Takifugu rubripes]|uniref:Rieske domain-containing protein n=1 Tax=Takifugu rubripes TaxID=31033 RepID=A0A674NV31_TAKRU|nr:Rieske domain-containing protein [Takifugu rubripes]XP_011612503.1 Rieske domain-containing protein [Takifugu rubripes]XP_029683287.1 Rieske domain-containing protein [Takifugu rubripes]|eukprot:XP_003973641.1 PREDICTED: Rieske domain-containing protein [Takifugu rubripes]
MEEEEQPRRGPHFVGKKEELIEAKRTLITVGGRDILVLHHQGVFYALDCYCYHSGGNLQNGDIEELGSRLCITCPKHKYKISLAEGEGMFKGTDPTVKPPVAKWYTKGVKQRVHAVTETNGDVYITLSDDRCYIESDYYQGEVGKERRAKAAAQEKAS